MQWCAKGFLCQLLLSYFFYNSWSAVPFLTPITVFLVYYQWIGWREQVLFSIETGFKEWLFYVKSGLSSGKSVELAIWDCKNSFSKCVGMKNPILPGLEQIYRGLELRVPIEKCIHEFGEATGVEAIQDFAVVFQIAKRQGGQMTVILERTIRHICAQIDLRMEISSMIYAKKLEQRIMCIMPFGIMFFVGRASGGYFTPLYHNLQGTLIMSVCMGVYLGGVWWGECLTRIRI